MPQRRRDESRRDHRLSSSESRSSPQPPTEPRLRRMTTFGSHCQAPRLKAPSAICTNASTSANCASKARKKAHRLPPRNTPTWSAICSSTFARAFVQTLAGQGGARLARADLAYYDKIIEISREPLQARATLPRSTSTASIAARAIRSRIQTAIVNLRTAKIQLLQLLNDRTPVEQFDVTGPFDFSDD